MKCFIKAAAASALLLVIGSISANAACNSDASTETVLGAGSGALVGGFASHSVAGAAIGGVAGGLIGNSIGQSNNREDCRRDAYYGDDQYTHYQGDRAYYPNTNYPYANRSNYPDTTYQGANRAYYPEPTYQHAHRAYSYPDTNGGYWDNSTNYYDDGDGSRYYDEE